MYLNGKLYSLFIGTFFIILGLTHTVKHTMKINYLTEIGQINSSSGSVLVIL